MSPPSAIAALLDAREHLNQAGQLIDHALADLETSKAKAASEKSKAVAPGKKMGRPKSSLVPLVRDQAWFVDDANHLSPDGRKKLFSLFGDGYNTSQAARLMSITPKGAAPHYARWKKLK